MATFYVPVVLNPEAADRKVLVVRQPADDPANATALVRRRYPRARVHAARTMMLTREQMAELAVDKVMRRARIDRQISEDRRAERALKRELRSTLGVRL